MQKNFSLSFGVGGIYCASRMMYSCCAAEKMMGELVIYQDATKIGQNIRGGIKWTKGRPKKCFAI